MVGSEWVKIPQYIGFNVPKIGQVLRENVPDRHSRKGIISCRVNRPKPKSNFKFHNQAAKKDNSVFIKLDVVGVAKYSPSKITLHK